MNERNLHILLAEDDLNLGYLLGEFLESHGHRVKLCRDGNAALKAFSSGEYNFCIFDVMLPGLDGFHLARSVRSVNRNIPVIFLTARGMKEDKLKGYGLGADDYITKPFDEDELLCRIRAVANRTEPAVRDISDKPVTIGRFEFDFANLVLHGNGESRRLTSREAEVLNLLCINRNSIVRREQILTAIWGENDYFAGRSLDVFISKLRKYFAADPSIRIENIPKVGFQLCCS